jgi:hypothetical protein
VALKERKYKCTFCFRGFVRKTWYDKHMCDKKQRFLDRNNITVIRAHRLFNHWQRRTGMLRRKQEKSLEDFCKSPLYTAFVRLSEFTSTEYVVSGAKYVDWLVDNKVEEQKWCKPRDLDDYRIWIRATEEPAQQAETSCKNIRVWCADNDVGMPEFFKSISPGQALNMVRENKLSPWVLIGYQTCVDDLLSRFSDAMVHTLNDHINVPYWLDKTEKDEAGMDKVRTVLDKKLHVS